MTVWLTGMLAIASAIMCIGLWPIVQAEMRAQDVTWRHNKALRIAGALYIHGASAIILFAAIPIAAEDVLIGAAAYVLWIVLALWLVAKTLIISVSGRLQTAAIMFVGWSAGCALYALMGGMG